jgi:hypothetical protein
MSIWADPDGRETLWRITDLRWKFDSNDGAAAFHAKTVAHFKAKHFTVTPCDVAMGDECVRLFSGDELPDGTPHTEIGFLFRLGAIVAELEGAEGPRVGSRKIRDDLVLPFAKRAEQRIRAAVEWANSPPRMPR